MQCPKCKSEYQAGLTECPKCGIIFEKYIAYMRRQIAKKKELMTNCPVCEKLISKNAEMCPCCGEPMQSKKPVQPQQIQPPPVQPPPIYEKIVNHGKKPPKSYGCGAAILIVIAIFVFGFIFEENDTKKSKPKPAANIPKVQKPKEPKPKEPTEVVFNSSWDGSVYQVKRYLKNNLKDPDSFEAIEWSPVIKVDTPTHKYIVRCKYRAKNSFGGYVIEQQLFYLTGSGDVVNVMKYK